jgi:transcriptional regulator with XRE-family HTH domain
MAMRPKARNAPGIEARLIEWREHLGLTQDQMAERLGLHTNTYAKSERGERAMDAGELSQLRSTGVSLEWLVTGNGEMRLQETTSSHEHDVTEVEVIGTGEEILRRGPKIDASIPDNINSSIDSLKVFLRAGKRSYNVAIVIAKHIAEQIQEELSRG